MKLFVTCPGVNPHGGIRIILEWASRLAARGHEVVLRVEDKHRRGFGWYPLPPEVRVVYDDRDLRSSDVLLVTSPHGLEYLEYPRSPARRFIFLQMIEHLFKPDSLEWRVWCRRLYLAPCPVVVLAEWQESYLRTVGRTGEIYRVGNGVNFEHFPLEPWNRDARAVLVEGWIPGNPTKDRLRIAQRVARELRIMGYKVFAYGMEVTKKDEFANGFDGYVYRPDLEELNDLYRSAAILLKATECDARSCSPLEAFTKCVPTARAIDYGDDDLVDGRNCLRVGYGDPDALLEAAVALLEDKVLRRRLGERGARDLRAHPWDYWIDRVEDVIRSL